MAGKIIRTALLCGLLALVGCSSDSDEGLFDDGLLSVGPGGDFVSIQAAVDAAPGGATITVGPGTYTERVVIDKSLTLIGAGAASKIELGGSGQPDPDDTGAGIDSALEVRDTVGVIVRGFTVRGPADGVRVQDSSDVVLQEIVASDNGDEGVDIRGSSEVEVSGIFESNGDEGVQIREGSQGVVVHASTMRLNAQDGVKIRDSTNCIVRDNVVRENSDDGVLVRNSGGVEVLNNEIAGNIGFGLRIGNSPDIVFEDNTIQNNVAGDIEID